MTTMYGSVLGLIAQDRNDERDLESHRIRVYRYTHKARVSAQSAVMRAVRSGKLIRPSVCPRCGKGGRIDAHHKTYKRGDWLDVYWLCKPCYAREQHRDAPNDEDGLDLELRKLYNAWAWGAYLIEGPGADIRPERYLGRFDGHSPVGPTRSRTALLRLLVTATGYVPPPDGLPRDVGCYDMAVFLEWSRPDAMTWVRHCVWEIIRLILCISPQDAAVV